MNVVSYGGGTNSTAMLVGMFLHRIPVDMILFADPGGEHPHTYEYIKIFDDWLVNHGLPKIEVVHAVDKAFSVLLPMMKKTRSSTDISLCMNGAGIGTNAEKSLSAPAFPFPENQAVSSAHL